MFCWQNNRLIDWCNRIESPEIDPHKYSQQIFDKEQRQYNESKTVFSIDGARTTGHPYVKKKKKKNLGTDLTSFTKINSK